MPIRDKETGYGQRTVRVPKSGLDPFNKRQQALDVVKREVPAPTPPNATGIRYEAEDKGDHYEVTLQAEKRGAGPMSLSRAIEYDSPGQGVGVNSANGNKGVNGMRDELGMPGHGEEVSPDKPYENRDSFDLGDYLSSNYSAPELMDIARRNGIHAPGTTDTDALATAIMDEDPLLARRLAGR